MSWIRITWKTRLNSTKQKQKQKWKRVIHKVTRSHWLGIFKRMKKSRQIKETIESGNAPKTWTDRYLVQDGLIYYLSVKGVDIRPRLHVSKIISGYILKDCHDKMRHLRIDKIHDLIKYYWPGLYKEINKYISACMICQLRSHKQNPSPLRETDIPSYPFQKISMDISGPYCEPSLANNNQIRQKLQTLLTSLPHALVGSSVTKYSWPK